MSCPDCFSGHTHDGKPLGEVTKLHGYDVYVAKPSGENVAPKGIIIIVPDAFGWEFVNNRILADHYAEKGKYLVYLPEFMKGHAAPVSMIPTMKAVMKTDSIMDWIKKPYHIVNAIYGIGPFAYFNRPATALPHVRTFFQSVRQNEGATLPVGAAGFCWGGKFVVNLADGTHTTTSSSSTTSDGASAGPGRPLIDAGFTGHPSRLTIPDEIERIKIPVSFAVGDKDMALKMPQIEQIKSIVENNKSGEVRVYPGAGHGFCVRADHVLEDATKQAEEAEGQALEWFERHFSKVETVAAAVVDA